MCENARFLCDFAHFWQKNISLLPVFEDFSGLKICFYDYYNCNHETKKHLLNMCIFAHFVKNADIYLII
jgi:hypothetical protein